MVVMVMMALGHPSLACIEAMLIAVSQIEPPVNEPIQIIKTGVTTNSLVKQTQ